MKKAWARSDSDRKWVLEVTVTEICARSVEVTGTGARSDSDRELCLK